MSHPYERKRHPIEIKIEILQAINDGICVPTRIMYKVNVTWVTWVTLIKEMEKNGLTAKTFVKYGKRPERKIWVITDKGKQVLNKWKEAVRELQ